MTKMQTKNNLWAHMSAHQTSEEVQCLVLTLKKAKAKKQILSKNQEEAFKNYLVMLIK